MEPDTRSKLLALPHSHIKEKLVLKAFGANIGPEVYWREINTAMLYPGTGHHDTVSAHWGN